MTDLEVFLLSAKACGHEAIIDDGTCWIVTDGLQKWLHWNPFIAPDKRWECVRKLLENGGDLILCDIETKEDHEWSRGCQETLQCWHSNCPAEEFPARALAELEARNAR